MSYLYWYIVEEKIVLYFGMYLVLLVPVDIRRIRFDKKIASNEKMWHNK